MTLYTREYGMYFILQIASVTEALVPHLLLLDWVDGFISFLWLGSNYTTQFRYLVCVLTVCLGSSTDHQKCIDKAAVIFQSFGS